MEESFGDSGLEEDTAFSFRHNKAYLSNAKGDVPDDFIEWKEDLHAALKKESIYLIFNTYEKEENGKSAIHLNYLKAEKKGEYTFDDIKKVETFKNLLINYTEQKFGTRPTISENASTFGVKNNNILLYIYEEIGADVILINILQDYIINEKIFSFAAIMADSIKESFLLESE